MSDDVGQSYLRDAILSATPEQLHLMLYDGAIRFAAQGRDAIAARRWESAYELLSRAQKIVLEMQAGLRREVDAELADRMSAIYTFIFGKLVQGGTRRDVAAVDDALKILAYQRQTWLLLIEKVRDGAVATSAAQCGDDPAALSIEA